MLAYCKPEAYSEPWHIQNSVIFRILTYWELEAYSEPCDTDNPHIFRTLARWEPKAYSEPCQTSLMECFAKIVNNYNYFCNIIFSFSLLYDINIMKFYNSGLIFTPEVYILCKKV